MGLPKAIRWLAQRAASNAHSAKPVLRAALIKRLLQKSVHDIEETHAFFTTRSFSSTSTLSR
ncbi:hypothetical protein KCP73_24570 [Salmonella enterica subsp. enterica]|nr:hypothetical protein KCP73_24570 [Salmonella enterica subsp. enterica]